MGRRTHSCEVNADATFAEVLDIECLTPPAGKDNTLQIRQALQHCSRKRCALTHQAKYFEVTYSFHKSIFVRKGSCERNDLGPGLDVGPIRHRLRATLIIVENGDVNHLLSPNVFIQPQTPCQTARRCSIISSI